MKSGLREIQRQLRRARPVPPAALVAQITERVTRTRRGRSHGSLQRLGFVGALTVATVVALGSVGGLGYAASSVHNAAKAAAHIVTPAKHNAAAAPDRPTAGGDQYRPGYGYGDPNHNHSGPPALNRAGGAFAPPPRASYHNGTAYVKTSFTIDEQADVTISVVDPHTGKTLLLTENKSDIGQGVAGPQAKEIHYRVLVPRNIEVVLAIPRNLLVPGRSYVIAVSAVDPQGNRSTLRISFIA